MGWQQSALTLVWSTIPHVQQGLLDGNTTAVFYGFRNASSPTAAELLFSTVSFLAWSDKMLLISCSMEQQAVS